MQWKFELLRKPTAVPLTEGPVWDGEQLLFTHIRASLILRYDPKSGAISEWRTGTNRTNGLAFDVQGRLFGCCSGGRAIVRFDPDGKNVVVADRLDGKKLSTPNDLAIDRKGRIWFTNPVNEGNWDKSEVEELDHRSVLRADPQKDGKYTVTRVKVAAGKFVSSPTQLKIQAVKSSSFARTKQHVRRAGWRSSAVPRAT